LLTLVLFTVSDCLFVKEAALQIEDMQHEFVFNGVGKNFQY
jgi:hypothetical protein